MRTRERACAAMLGLMLCATSLSGCASAIADDFGDVSSFVAGTPKAEPRAVRIFVASTRAPEDGPAPEAPTGAAHFSLTTISVPAGHQAGSIERPAFGPENRLDHFVVASRRPFDEVAFGYEIASHISGRIGSNRDILLFVHGFNTSFDEARFRLAQIVTDGGFGGVPVLFTWPSRGSLLGYGSDRETAMASRDALERLMASLARAPDIGKIHILGHSMGAWLAMEALRENAIGGHPDLDGHLGDIMLAAPDIDLDVFRQQMARLGSFAHVSIFAASNDRALAVSGILADRPRLGALDPDKAADRAMMTSLGVKVVDLSRDSTSWIGHATYANAPQVVRGIGAEIGAARTEDRDTQAVLDGSEVPLEPGPPAPSAAVVARPLPPPTAGLGQEPAPAVSPAPDLGH